MAVDVVFRGASVKGASGKFESFLDKKWNEMSDALVQKVMIYGGEEAKRCAEDLLKAAKDQAPVSVEHNYNLGETLESAQAAIGRRGKVSKASSKVGHDLNVQMRTTLGTYTKAIPVYRDKDTNKLKFTDEKPYGGSLRDSGLVEPFNTKSNRTGYSVSFDTRRTDARSVENNFNYAYIQHEKLEYKHKVGNAKFLERPYTDMKEEFKRRLAQEVKNGIREGAHGK